MINEKLFLIDGNSFMFRAYYAIKSLTNSKGQPTNAIYGFVNMLNKLLKKEEPQYLAVVFDVKAPTFRHKKFKDYKAHRKPAPDDLIMQFPIIKEILRAYSIKIFEKAGFEADDVLATIASLLKTPQLTIYIVTSDKDILQIIDKNVKMYNPHQGGVIYDEVKVKVKFGGISPGQITDVMGLAGDASDNIPGVPGIGEKTAIFLIKQFGSLEEVLANVDKINSLKLKSLLTKYADQAKLSKELSVINNNVDIKVSLEDLKRVEPDRKKLFNIFNYLEFKNLLNEKYRPSTSNSN